MIIFKDKVTGDELFSDIYKMKLVDDVLYEVEGKITTETAGHIDESLIGGNASAEGGEDEATAASSKSGCNIVLANRLVETGFKNKKEYQVHIKAYMKKVQDDLTETNPERVESFKAGAKIAVKKILEFFKDLQFFIGESSDPDGMHVLMNFRDDGITPYMLFWKDGLIEEKV